ncbi:MAG: hypothetical protein ACI9I4_002316 [Neolewinella sp.]|jgi:hypothetical protein
MLKTGAEKPLIPHLAVCITFFYVPARLTYLSTIIANYIGIAEKTDVYIVTNVADTTPINDALAAYRESISIQFVTPTGLGHPFLLTWTHREVFKQISSSSQASHFLYSEDDLLFGRSNVSYWLRYREALRAQGLFPSFFRVEKHHTIGWVSTDCISPLNLGLLPSVQLSDGAFFVCMKNPYQGMYFLDRELMEEFASSPAMSPDFGKWEIREKASQGLTFVNIPEGYTSRNVVLVNTSMKSIPKEAWIHHLPNNYATNPNSEFGKVSMAENELFPTHSKGGLKQRIKKLIRSIRNK